MPYPKVVWDFEKPERVLSPEEQAEATGEVRVESGEYGLVTYGCAECARLRAWMKSLGVRGQNEETLPRASEFVCCFKARKEHEEATEHVAFGWRFDKEAVKAADEHKDHEESGAFWRALRATFLLPKKTM